MGLKEKYAVDNPANTVRPDLKFVFSCPEHAIALFFGVGLLRPAPGTWGTAAGVLVWIALIQFAHLPASGYLALIAAGLLLGVWASEKTDQDLGVHDAGCIVIDEVVGVWLVLMMFPQHPITWAASFLVFRFFDIVKFPPTDKIDEKFKGGKGVMADDVVAALWAIVALTIFDKAAGRFGYTFLGLLS